MIRHATIADLTAIREIWNYYILHTTYNYDYEPKSMAFMEEWFHKKVNLGCPHFLPPIPPVRHKCLFIPA